MEDLNRLPTGVRHEEVSSIRITEAKPSELDEPVSEPDSNTRQGSVAGCKSIHSAVDTFHFSSPSQGLYGEELWLLQAALCFM